MVWSISTTPRTWRRAQVCVAQLSVEAPFHVMIDASSGSMQVICVTSIVAHRANIGLLFVVCSLNSNLYRLCCIYLTSPRAGNGE